MDYTMPRADDVPSFQLSTTETACPSNPLGIKGCGEAGAIGSPPAVINAITDAIGTPMTKWFTSVSFPGRTEKSAYAKYPNPASRYAMAGVFVAQGSDGSINGCRHRRRTGWRFPRRMTWKQLLATQTGRRTRSPVLHRMRMISCRICTGRLLTVPIL
jgi:hypothetical protein